jgi:hypothetical protein
MHRNAEIGDNQITAPTKVMLVLACLGVALALWVVEKVGVSRRANLEYQRSNEIAAESRSFCEKWGISAGTQKHAECITDLEAIREHQAKRTSDDTELF